MASNWLCLYVRFGSFAVLRLNSNCSVRKIKVGAQKRSVVGQKRTFNYYLKTQAGLKIAPKTLTNFLERIARLYTPKGHEG